VPPGEDPPAVPVAADNAAARAVAAEAEFPAAPAARGSGGSDNQRGRKSQAAKQRAASAALNKQLDTTLRPCHRPWTWSPAWRQPWPKKPGPCR